MSVAGYARGLFFCILLYCSAFFGLCFIMCPSLILIPLKKYSWFRQWNDYWQGLWLTYPGAIFELGFGTKIVMKGDTLDDKDNPLIIINHRCRLDWMFYWMPATRTGRLGNEKIIMKNELRHVPGIGWCMQYVLYTFLKRKWESDKVYLERYLNYFIDIKYPLQFFLFPEGTDYCKNSKGRSDKFAEKNNLPKYEYVLHPRVTGFNFLVQKTRHNLLDCVYDVTIGFPVNLCYGEKDLLRGDFPKEIHFLFKKYSMDELPDNDKDLSKWLTDRWAEKEQRLKSFYEQGRFTGPEAEGSPSSPKQEENTYIAYVISIVCWTWFVVYGFYLAYSYTWIMVYMLAVIVGNFILCTWKGMDWLQLDIHEKEKLKKE